MAPDRLFHAIDYAIVSLFAGFLVELQLSFDVFSWECNANLNATSNATWKSKTQAHLTEAFKHENWKPANLISKHVFILRPVSKLNSRVSVIRVLGESSPSDNPCHVKHCPTDLSAQCKIDGN